MPEQSELFSVITPDDALGRLAAHLPARPRLEWIPSADAVGRVLAEDLTSPEDLPAFARSVMDGYAVRASDTHGASAGLPALLRVVGEAPMGAVVNVRMGPGDAVLVHTGSMLPPDADAIVMVEYTSRAGPAAVEVMRAVAAGEHVLNVGEDVQRGQPLFAAGHRLRPQDIGGLAALGVVRVPVAVRPRVAILSTGDEVVQPDVAPGIGQVRDVNAHALAALVTAHGGEPVRCGIVPDDRVALTDALKRASAQCDMLVLSAGSSVSYRDLSVEVIDALGAPGVLAHGISVKPGKPTIVAVCDGVPVFGLPGNPVSAMIVARLLVVPTMERLLGARSVRPATVRARLSRNLASSTGRLDFVQVKLEARSDGLWAVPLLGKSNMIFTMAFADGSIVIPLDSNGLQAGDWVDVGP